MAVYRIPDAQSRKRELVIIHKGESNVDLLLNSGTKQQTVEVSIKELENILADITRKDNAYESTITSR